MNHFCSLWASNAMPDNGLVDNMKISIDNTRLFILSLKVGDTFHLSILKILQDEETIFVGFLKKSCCSNPVMQATSFYWPSKPRAIHDSTELSKKRNQLHYCFHIFQTGAEIHGWHDHYHDQSTVFKDVYRQDETIGTVAGWGSFRTEIWRTHVVILTNKPCTTTRSDLRLDRCQPHISLRSYKNACVERFVCLFAPLRRVVTQAQRLPLRVIEKA